MICLIDMKAVIETFRPVMGYEGLYEVSNCGAVRSLKYGKVRYLKNTKTLKCYERICLCRDGKKKWFRVHRLVWEAFNGNIPDGFEIDHINTVRDDNRLSNLRVVTSKENHANPISVERNREAHRESNKLLSQDPKWREAQREVNRKSFNKPILQLDKTTGEVLREWECAADAWRELGIHFSSISACCHGKLKSAGGYRWCFA